MLVFLSEIATFDTDYSNETQNDEGSKTTLNDLPPLSYFHRVTRFRNLYRMKLYVFGLYNLHLYLLLSKCWFQKLTKNCAKIDGCYLQNFSSLQQKINKYYLKLKKFTFNGQQRTCNNFAKPRTKCSGGEANKKVTWKCQYAFNTYIYKNTYLRSFLYTVSMKICMYKYVSAILNFVHQKTTWLPPLN